MANKRKKRPDPVEALDGPTEAQLANGDYGDEFKPDPLGGNRVAKVKVNRGGTPLTRWLSANPPRLSSTQQVAIAEVLRLWELTGMKQSTTSKYGERIPGSGSEECRAVTVLEAKEDLKRIKGRFVGLESWWDIFENVCRWDEPAGVAGSRLGFGTRSAEDRAHQVVCMVADYIASKEGLAPVARIRAA